MPPPTSLPSCESISQPLASFATQGEFEPVSFAIYPLKDPGVVRAKMSEFAGSGGARIGTENIYLGVVRCLPQQARSSYGGFHGKYEILPN